MYGFAGSHHGELFSMFMVLAVISIVTAFCLSACVRLYNGLDLVTVVPAYTVLSVTCVVALNVSSV